MTSTDYLERQNLGPFDGDQARELLEQAHLVHELTLHPGWQILAGRIGVEITAWESRVMNGKCADQTEYVQCINYVKGLRHILEAPEALRAAAEKARPQQEEDDDE